MDYDGNFTIETTYSNNNQAAFFQFVSYGILLNLIGVMGLIGNVISMIVLSQLQMKSSMNYLLIWLTSCDSVLIVTSTFLLGLPAIFLYTSSDLYYIYQYKFISYLTLIMYPVALFAQTVSVYLTLTVTLERFVAVCHPLHVRSLCTYGRARLYVMIIIVFSALFNLPRFWEITIVEFTDTGNNSTVYVAIPSELGHNKNFMSIYIRWLYMVVIYFLPFSCLAILNIAIYKQVRRANQERQRLSIMLKREIGLTNMLLCEVVLFMTSNILPLITHLMGDLHEEIMIPVANLIVMINSSANFVIYVIFREQFKLLFLKIFCLRESCQSNTVQPDTRIVMTENIVITVTDKGPPKSTAIRHQTS